MILNESVSKIKNVGEKRLELLNKLHVFTIKDLITYYPRDYEDRSIIVSPSQIKTEGFYTVSAVIKKTAENAGFQSKTVTKLFLQDGNAIIEVVWFNQPYIKNQFKLNEKYVFAGEVIEKNSKFVMSCPDFEKIKDTPSVSFGRIIPKYYLTKNLSQKVLRSLIETVLFEAAAEFYEILPQLILNKYNLCDRQAAIKNIHFPENSESFYAARHRLVFEEILLMQLSLFKIKGILKEKSVFLVENTETSPITELLPFNMTNAQNKVLEQIKADFSSGFVMNRLIQGDVGSGKTAVAMVSAFIALNSAKTAQVAFMAPTEVLAFQHYNSLKRYFDKLNIDVTFLAGSLTPAEKRKIHEKIKTGDSRLIIGTHALIQEKVIFNDLRLVITDEQHRFGVRQRATLSEKGKTPHVLIMSATPIPRTLALILYGDMDISVIDELPPGRTKIDTFAVNSSYRQRLYAFLEKQVNEGRQAYIICPAIEESENKTLQSVLTYTESLKKQLPNLKIEALHGKMKPAVKSDIMERFSKGQISVIVSTTVIEVGIDVANATVMVIENADRFGLSQLHQLRGRVGRSALKSYCVMVSDSVSEVSKERLKAMTKTNDGFELSRLDLELRGPGDFFGTMQHGLPEMKIANFYKDIKILETVQKVAYELYENISQYSLLEKEIEGFIEKSLNTITL